MLSIITALNWPQLEEKLETAQEELKNSKRDLENAQSERTRVT